MSAPERKAVQDAVASLERTLGIEGKYEAGLVASATRIRQADAEIVTLRAEVERLRVAIDRLIRAGSDVVAADADGELTDDDIIDLETAIDAARGVKS